MNKLQSIFSYIVQECVERNITNYTQFNTFFRSVFLQQSKIVCLWRKKENRKKIKEK